MNLDPRPTATPVEFSVTFVGMVPDEELTTLVRKFAHHRAGETVSARIERNEAERRYAALVQRGAAAQSWEDRDPRSALCGAFELLELENETNA